MYQNFANFFDDKIYRSYFKTADKYRSESMSAVPRMRLKTDEELHDSLSRGNSLSIEQKVIITHLLIHNVVGLSQFEPGKLTKKYTSRFESDNDLGMGTVNIKNSKL